MTRLARRCDASVASVSTYSSVGNGFNFLQPIIVSDETTDDRLLIGLLAAASRLVELEGGSREGPKTCHGRFGCHCQTRRATLLYHHISHFEMNYHSNC